MTAAAARSRTTQLLSPRAFGLALGVTRQAVNKAIGTGRLRDAVSRDEHNGRALIDLEAGKAEWEAWTDPAKRHEKAGGRPSDASKGTPSMFDPEEQRATSVRTTLAETRNEQVSLDVELKRIELDQLRGTLVDRREVQREAFRLARSLRDLLQAIPDRIAENLAALDKPAQVHERLAAEIARALEAFERDENEDPKPKGRTRP